MFIHKIQICLLGMVLLISGCVKPPSTGEKMILQGAGTTSIGQEWVDGNNLIKKGNNHLHKGTTMVKKGEKLIYEGKHMIAKGNKMINDSEHTFHEKFPTIEIEK